MSNTISFDTALSAEVYGQLYPDKDYQGEAAWIHRLVSVYGPADARSILDAGCGAGQHLTYLHNGFPDAAGVDIAQAQLDRARQRLPDQVTLRQGDIADFDLDRQFDVVVCLFAAIAYLGDTASLQRGIRNLARHARPGGLVIIQPGFSPDDLPDTQQIRQRVATGPQGERIMRISNSGQRPAAGEGPVPLDMHFMYARLCAGQLVVSHFTEHHVIGAFHQSTYVDMMQKAGLCNVWAEALPEGMASTADQPLLIGRKLK